jgi:hypothetical protein
MIGSLGSLGNYGAAAWMTSTSTSGTTGPRRQYVPYQPARTATAQPVTQSPMPSTQPTYAPSGGGVAPQSAPPTYVPPAYVPPVYVDSSGSMFGIGADAVNQLFDSVPIGGGWPFSMMTTPATDKTKQVREPQGPSLTAKLLTVAVIGAAGYGAYRLLKR